MELARQFAAVAGIFVLLGAALWWLRSRGFAQLRPLRGSRGALRPFHHVANLALGPQHSLHLVRVADQGLVLAVHGGNCTLLLSRPWTELETPVPGDPGGGL